MLITGNPRTDQLWRPARPRQARRARHHRRLRRLDADLPRGQGGRRDARAVRARCSPRTAAPSLARTARRACAARPPAVIKPHPMDAEERAWDGAVTVTDADLVAPASASTRCWVSRGWSPTTPACGSTTCCSTARWPSSSPTATATAAPWCPPDVLDWVPGELVGPRRAVRGVPRGPRRRRPPRRTPPRAAATKIGLNPTHTSADDLLHGTPAPRCHLTGCVAPGRGRRGRLASSVPNRQETLHRVEAQNSRTRIHEEVPARQAQNRTSQTAKWDQPAEPRPLGQQFIRLSSLI